MKKILSNPKRTGIGVLIFLFAFEIVVLFAGAAAAYFQKTPSNEFGIGLLAAVAFGALALLNLFAFAVTYFILVKVIKIDRYPGLLWALKKEYTIEQISDYFNASIEMVQFRLNKSGVNKQRSYMSGRN